MNNNEKQTTVTRRGVAPKTEIAMWLKEGLLYNDIAEFCGCSEDRVREVARDMMKRAAQRGAEYVG